MNGYEIYIFFLCLVVFIALTTLFTIFTVWIVRLLVRIIRAGLEDEKIRKEYAKRQRLGKKVKNSEIFDRIISGLFGVLFLAVFIFSVGMTLTEEKMVGDIPVVRVVQSGSMSKKYEKNKYLFENDLNDQIQTFDLIVTKKLPDEKDLELYDIVVYEVDDILVVHRIIKIEEANATHPDCRWFTLQGDNVQFPDKTPVLYSQMRAIYEGDRIPYIGSFFAFMQSPAGYLCILLLIFGAIAIPLVEKILERERMKRLLREQQAAKKKALEEANLELPTTEPVQEQTEDKPEIEQTTAESVQPEAEAMPEEMQLALTEEENAFSFANLEDLDEPVASFMDFDADTDITLDALDEEKKNVYDGAYTRNTYDWFYDSLTFEERMEFIRLFVYREIGCAHLLPLYIIRGDNYAFFRIFFTNLSIYQNKVSATIIEKMWSYYLKNY